MATLGITNTLEVLRQADILRAGGSRVALLRGRDEKVVKALSNLGDEWAISGVESAEFGEEVESSRIGGGMVPMWDKLAEEERLRVISSKLIFLFMSGAPVTEFLPWTTRCWRVGLADSAPPESA